jgi:hypothetical protein
MMLVLEQRLISALQEPAVSIFKVEEWNFTTGLQSIISQKALTFIFTMRTSNLTHKSSDWHMGMASMSHHSATACQLESKLTAAHTVQLTVGWNKNLLSHAITAASSYV